MRAAVIIGVGEIGGVFARGFLKCGLAVIPLGRSDSPAQMAKEVPDPELVLVATAEADLDAVLAALPAAWRDRVALIQNELLPRDWQRHGLDDPTVASIWFEKKPGQEVKVLLPSPIYGPDAPTLANALAAMGIRSRILEDEGQLLRELVIKNVYILTTNVAGLKVGGGVRSLWQSSRDLALGVMGDVLTLQTELTGVRFDEADMAAALESAILADPEHRCMGRNAPDRLRRALRQADEFNVKTPVLRGIAESVEPNS
jgi:hypothetical protein